LKNNYLGLKTNQQSNNEGPNNLNAYKPRDEATPELLAERIKTQNNQYYSATTQP